MSKNAEVSPGTQSVFLAAPAAFVLAAGLGTRLRPLTYKLPKPLVPIFQKPLLTFALDSLIAAGAGTLALNTHHLPETFTEVFGSETRYRDRTLRIFHEPLLLDTGGGIRNARSALGEKTFFLYNGDILADLPLADLLRVHRVSGAMATLLLRESGGEANILFDTSSGRVIDVRGELGVTQGKLSVYSGIAVLEPAIFDWIPESGPYSIITSLIAALRCGEKIGGMIASDGLWIDIGNPIAYREAHRLLARPENRPRYLEDTAWPQLIHSEAQINGSALLEGMVAAGSGSVVGAGAVIRDSILWPGSVIEAGARLEECIVMGEHPVSGSHLGVIL